MAALFNTRLMTSATGKTSCPSSQHRTSELPGIQGLGGPCNLSMSTTRWVGLKVRGRKYFGAVITSVASENGKAPSNGTASRMVSIREALKGRGTTFLAGRPEYDSKPHGTSNGTSSGQKRQWQVPCEAATSTVNATAESSLESAERDVLGALSQIIDPDFGTDIVSCGFVKELRIEEATGQVLFQLELTTPACPVKDMFEQQAMEKVTAIPWVKGVTVKMTAQPPKPLIADDVPAGLKNVSNIIAVSSCKGGVGKSTVAVNLAYSLAGMGARVGIFDADVYGPSLPTMVSPDIRVLQMNSETRTIIPTEYMGVKLVSFGYAGQGSAIMRGPMVSGVINQLLTTTEWGELDYLVVDMPPGTGDIQLTLCQVVPLTAAVIVTTPQKLAFIDVAKGVRMFSKLKVPCVAVVENMCFFEGDGKRYYPFGQGSGTQVVEQFGIPHLFEIPIRPELSAAGDSGNPEVVVDPQGQVARVFSDIGVCVVKQCAKLRQQVSTAVMYDKAINVIRVKVPGTSEEFLLHPATVRRNDKSAKSIDEWSGEQRLRYSDVADDIEPESIRPMGNYAVSINWPDGFSQIAPYDQLASMERLVDVPEPLAFPAVATNGRKNVSSSESPSSDGAAAILKHAHNLKEKVSNSTGL